MKTPSRPLALAFLLVLLFAGPAAAAEPGGGPALFGDYWQAFLDYWKGVFQKQNGIGATGNLDARTRESIGRMQLRGDAVVVPPAASTSSSPASSAAASAAPALVVTPQTLTPAVEVRVSPAEMLATPASPQTAAMIRANRLKHK